VLDRTQQTGPSSPGQAREETFPALIGIESAEVGLDLIPAAAAIAEDATRGLHHSVEAVRSGLINGPQDPARRNARTRIILRAGSRPGAGSGARLPRPLSRRAASSGWASRTRPDRRCTSGPLQASASSSTVWFTAMSPSARGGRSRSSRTDGMPSNSLVSSPPAGRRPAIKLAQAPGTRRAGLRPARDPRPPGS